MNTNNIQHANRLISSVLLKI